MTIGEKIRDIRLKQGLTQADLGGDLVTPSMISQIEADRSKPSYSLLSEIASRLGMPIDYFMNSIDHQFLVAAQMSFAQYESAMERPERALEQLKHSQQAPGQGLNHQEHTLMLAQVFRKLKRFNEAVSQLEQLRELAYRTQDHRLLFLVFRESGYVEVDLENMDGALHEWQQAVEIGRQLEPSDAISNMDLTVLMTDILLKLDDAMKSSTRPNSTSADDSYLEEACEWLAKTPDLRAITEKLMEDATNSIVLNPARAKSLADKANTLMTFSHMIEQHVAVQTRLTAQGDGTDGGSWQHTAFTMTTVYPETYLTTTCDQIERHIKSGFIDAARVDFLNANRVLQKLPSETDTPDRQHISLRLQLFDVQIQDALGNRDKSIEALTQFEASFPNAANVHLHVKACALLVLWFGEQGDTEKVLFYCKRMEELMMRKTSPAPLFI